MKGRGKSGRGENARRKSCAASCTSEDELILSLEELESLIMDNVEAELTNALEEDLLQIVLERGQEERGAFAGNQAKDTAQRMRAHCEKILQKKEAFIEDTATERRSIISAQPEVTHAEQDCYKKMTTTTTEVLSPKHTTTGSQTRALQQDDPFKKAGEGKCAPSP